MKNYPKKRHTFPTIVGIFPKKNRPAKSGGAMIHDFWRGCSNLSFEGNLRLQYA